MAQLRWTSDLDTGIEAIDKQHRRIIEYINILKTAHDKADLSAVNNVLAELVDYTISHFSFEEELQQKANYPFLKAHKRVHEIFTRQVADLQQRAKNGDDVTAEILSMLEVWLVNHIKGDDADYVECVKRSLGLDEEKEERGWLGKTLKKFLG